MQNFWYINHLSFLHVVSVNFFLYLIIYKILANSILQKMCGFWISSKLLRIGSTFMNLGSGVYWFKMTHIRINYTHKYLKILIPNTFIYCSTRQIILTWQAYNCQLFLLLDSLWVPSFMIYFRNSIYRESCLFILFDIYRISTDSCLYSCCCQKIILQWQVR